MGSGSYFCLGGALGIVVILMMGIVIIAIFGHNSIGYGNDIAIVMIIFCYFFWSKLKL